MSIHVYFLSCENGLLAMIDDKVGISEMIGRFQIPTEATTFFCLCACVIK